MMARAMHPADYFPTTVLLPQFYPYTRDQEEQDMWEYHQKLIAEHTKFGFDENRKETDWEAINKKMERARNFKEQSKLVRDLFYAKSNYIQETMEKYFNNVYPVYLKKAFGGGGSDVYRIKSLEELYAKYDETGGKTFHIQEAIENFDVFVRCMSIGPQVLPMKYQPDAPLHQHYSPEKLILDETLHERICNYSLFINSYYRWSYNSFEALIKNGKISPIDFANACPDSNFTSLHSHFPWLICSLLKWFSYCAVSGKDTRYDMEQSEYLSVFNDPNKSDLEKYEFHVAKSKDYFQVDDFNQFCEENFADINEKMIEFYDRRVDDLIGHAIYFSDFPKEEHNNFFHYYKNLMETNFRKDPMRYLTIRP